MLTGSQANEAFFRAPEDVLSARECYQFTIPVFGPGLAYDMPPEEMDRQPSFVHPALRCWLGDEIRRHFSTEFARLYHDLDGGVTATRARSAGL